MELNFSGYDFRYKEGTKGKMIFDPFRKKYVPLTPEEWVRQNLLQWLVLEKAYPPALISVEMTLHYQSFKRRCDAVVFSRNGKPLLIVECKAPEVDITQATFDQIARYNFQLSADFLLVSNGKKHYCCKMDYGAHQYSFLEEVPSWSRMDSQAKA